jgi:hypothetical protein
MGSQLNERLDALSSLNTPHVASSGSSPASGTQDAALARLSFPTLESILLWPIFQDCNLGLHPHQSLALRRADETQHHSTYAETLEPAPDGNLVHAAVESFLENVHVKNPILDVQSLQASIDMCLSSDTQCSEQWALLVSDHLH